MRLSLLEILEATGGGEVGGTQVGETFSTFHTDSREVRPGGIFFALRTGSGESVQGLFPLLFVGLFLSSMNLPRNLIEVDWFRFAATINPVSYLIEGVRSLIITGWDAEALALGFGVAGAVAVVSLAAATWALNGRLTRT